MIRNQARWRVRRRRTECHRAALHTHTHTHTHTHVARRRLGVLQCELKLCSSVCYQLYSSNRIRLCLAKVYSAQRTWRPFCIPPSALLAGSLCISYLRLMTSHCWWQIRYRDSIINIVIILYSSTAIIIVKREGNVDQAAGGINTGSCLWLGHWARRWINHAWLVRRQTYGYLPNRRASPTFDRY